MQKTKPAAPIPTNSKSVTLFGSVPHNWLPRLKKPPRKRRPTNLEFVDISKLLRGAWDVHSFALNGIFVLLVIYTLYFGRTVILPVVVSIFLSFLLRPLVRKLHNIGLPESVGAVIVLSVFLITLVFGVSRLVEPASNWMRKAPDHLQAIEGKISHLLRPAQKVSQAADRVDHMTAGTNDAAVQTVELKSPGLLDTVMLGTKSILGGIVITLGLLYFLLAAGDFFLRKWVEILPTMTEKKRAVAIDRELIETMSTYLTTITITNIVLGALTTMALSFLGMPNPVLWGALGGFLNYIPYLGALIGIVIIGLVAVLHFDSVGYALIAPAIYWGLTALESGLISPIFLGRQLTLNPVAIFGSLVFWGWLWGIPGTLLAVPILVALKIICDHTKPLVAIGKFLGR